MADSRTIAGQTYQILDDDPNRITVALCIGA